MPALSVKELYLATSIEKLDKEGAIADVSKQRTANLCKSALKLYKSAEECYLLKDEEKAYVQFSKYVCLILTIKKRTDFAEDKSSKLLSENAKTAMTRAERLKDSLLKRYSILREIEFRENNEKNGEMHSIPKKVISEESNVESATGNNLAKENGSDKVQAVEETISSERLYSLFQNPHLHSSIILMDVRSERDFEESHIKHSYCISIPREILKAGITAAALEQLLPDNSLSKWQKRGNAEYIVLIDSDFKDRLLPGSHLHTLKQAMCKWDQNCSLKKPPMILQGGYRDWMLRYPMHTTKALGFPSFSSVASVTPIADVSGVEYPNLDDNSAEKKAEVTNVPDPLFKKSKPPENINNITPTSDQDASRNNQIKSAPTFNRNAKPSNIADRGLSADTATNRNDMNNRTPGLFARITNPIHSNNPSSSSSEALKPFPNINRKLKPSKNEEALMTALSKEENLAKESLDIAKEQLMKENEFEKLRMRKALEAEESKRMEIQKQEDSLRERMKQLEENARVKDLELNKVKEENAKMKKFLDEHMDKEFQKQKEKEILDAEIKKKSLQEDVERLRELRRKQEKNTQKKIEILKPDINHREVASANSALKRNTYHEPELTKQSNSTEYTVSLSKQTSYDGSSKGLVRSHSSPNIAEMVNQEEIIIPRKLPLIDRSLKPKPTSPIQHSEINRARLRNLNPVYGNSLVRPATGIRNLGNTCFMNSIIQCLSNTTPLAYYFTSREYTRDINRENKQGTGGELAEEFAVIIQALWMGQYKSFSPKDFKNTVSRCLSVCIGNEQQDSHEFLVVLMEKLHSDLNKRCERILLPKLEDKPEHVAKEMFWRHHKTVNCSKISEIFDGLLKSTLTCMVCQKTSNNFEVFSCLSLPILSYKCSLRDCLQHFLKPEKMSGEAAWDCPRCKQKKDAEKRLFISRLPDILIIQLKRFSYDGMWRRKLQTHVDFDTGFEMPFEDNNEIRSRSYTLYGIVNHYGTLEGGHYTAYCRNSAGRKWYKYDDHEVSEISSSDIKTSAAYLLFYNAIDYS